MCCTCFICCYIFVIYNSYLGIAYGLVFVFVCHYCYSKYLTIINLYLCHSVIAKHYCYIYIFLNTVISSLQQKQRMIPEDIRKDRIKVNCTYKEESVPALSVDISFCHHSHVTTSSSLPLQLLLANNDKT